MDWLEALILGIIQGLTEYLPVSSSGHLELGNAILGVEMEENLTFDVMLHVATVLSTLVILWREIDWILKGLFKWQLNEETRYVLNIIVSMIPVAIVGFLFKDKVEALFTGNILLVGCCLMVTAALLIFTYFARPRKKEQLSPRDAFIMGIAQAVAVLPGISRSGSTIATGLLLGNKKERLAQFSFLMVIPPILGQALLSVKDFVSGEETFGGIGAMPMLIGFAAAFISGCFACKWMINIVKRGKLVYFGIYCAIVGFIAIVYSLI